jgi:hypothetical protein
MLIFADGGKPENRPEKNPRSKGENQQQSQLTYITESGNRTRVTVVRAREASALTANDATPCFHPSNNCYVILLSSSYELLLVVLAGK